MKGLTVNRVSGVEARIAERYAAFAAEVETMEGAAFFQACLKAEIPFYAFRGLSYYVESRNRENWELIQAVEAVQLKILAFLEEIG